MTAGYQLWTVPQTGDYSIEAYGARGASNSSGTQGANGARMYGEFSLTQGQVLKILVGQIGSNSPNANSSAGGGGTFVVDNLNDDPLIIAGGGGGVGANGSQPGVAGTINNCGT